MRNEPMDDLLAFADRNEFRAWLGENCTSSGGVWLLFGKKGGPQTLSAAEALEEALCFGWIDGQMQRIDDKSYKKYFAPRRTNSTWSDKNKSLAHSLEERGLMTDFGRQKIEEAKQNGRWDAPDLMSLGAEAVSALSALLSEHETARINFHAMPPSAQKTYARAYFSAKTDAGRQKRLEWLVDRLSKNLKPME